MKRKYTIATTIYLIVFLLLSACQPSDNSSTIDKISEDSIIASYETGQLTIAELEAFIINLAAKDRWSHADPEMWIRGLIEKIVSYKKLLAESLLVAANEEPKYKNQVHNISRSVFAQQYLATFPVDKGLTEEDLVAYYDNHIDQYVLAEKRQVHHIYKNNKNENAREELESLRERHLNGENFMLLAEQFSDSETRHNKGRLGLLQAGDMSVDFDSVVFALEKNKPSEVIKTANGYHLFLVTDILQAKSYGFEQVKNHIRSQLREQYIMDNLKQKAMQLTVPEPFFLPTAEELSRMNLNKNPRKIILRVGDYQMSFNQFISELNEIKKSSRVNIDKDYQLHYLQTVAYSEIIYQDMLKNETPLIHNDSLEKQKQALLVSEYTNSRIASYLNNHPAIVKVYFDKNRMRFSTPVEVQLHRLMIPKQENINLMPELESAIETLDKGTVSLKQLAERYNGNVQNLGWKTSVQLANIDRQILKYAFFLKINEFSPPYTNTKFYSILKLVDKKDPIEQPLSQVRKQVINEFKRTNSAQIYAEISKELLSDVKIDEAVLKAFINKQAN